MSTFSRRGHYRQGPNGQPVWVQPHEVTRSEGSANSYTPSPQATIRISNAAGPSVPKISRPKSTRWAEPNARCPVCGAAVYFYKNEAGSRVYFDEIGAPWSKHPCTDIPFFTRATAELRGQPVEPALREPSPRGGKASRRRRQHRDDRDPSGNSYAYQAFTVQGSEVRTNKTLLRLLPVPEAGAVRLLEVSGVAVPLIGQLVFVDAVSLSYFKVAHMSIVQLRSTFIAEPTPVSTPARKGSRSQPPVVSSRTNSDFSPLTLRKNPVPTEPRKSASTVPERQVMVTGEDVGSGSTAGCGISMLLFFLIILIWLIFGFWGPGNHSLFGVLGGLAMTLVTAFGFMMGFTMLASEKSERDQDIRHVPDKRPQHVAATPPSSRNTYSLFREE